MSFANLTIGKIVDFTIDALQSASQAEVWAFAEGNALQWCDSTHRYLGILVDHPIDNLQSASPLEAWAYAAECCEYPPDLTLGFVEQNNWPPYGISQDIKALFHNVGECANLDCSSGTFQYNAGTAHWTGSPAGVSLDYHLNVVVDTTFDPTGCTLRTDFTDGVIVAASNWHTNNRAGATNLITLLPCPDAGGTTHFIQSTFCAFPFYGTHSSDIFPGSVCACSGRGHVTAEFFGFCKRLRLGRWVDVILDPGGSGKMVEVWATGGNCSPCVQGSDCCNMWDGCMLAATVELTLPCVETHCQCMSFGANGGFTHYTGPFNICAGTYPPNGVPLQVWANCAIASPAVTCANGHSQTLWTAQIEFGPVGARGSCSVQATALVCNCSPPEIVFPVMACDNGHGDSVSLTLTLSFVATCPDTPTGAAQVC